MGGVMSGDTYNLSRINQLNQEKYPNYEDQKTQGSIPTASSSSGSSAKAQISSTHRNVYGNDHLYVYHEALTELEKYDDNAEFHVRDNEVVQVQTEPQPQQVRRRTVSTVFKNITSSIMSSTREKEAPQAEGRDPQHFTAGELKQHIYTKMTRYNAAASNPNEANTNITTGRNPASMRAERIDRLRESQISAFLKFAGDKVADAQPLHLSSSSSTPDIKLNNDNYIFTGRELGSVQQGSSLWKSVTGTMIPQSNANNAQGQNIGPVSFLYTGAVNGQRFQGQGTLIINDENGRVTHFEGEFNSGLKHGQGNLRVINEGEDYRLISGQFRNDNFVQGTISLVCHEDKPLAGMVVVKEVGNDKTCMYVTPGGKQYPNCTFVNGNVVGSDVFVNASQTPIFVHTRDPSNPAAPDTCTVYRPIPGQKGEFYQETFTGNFSINQDQPYTSNGSVNISGDAKHKDLLRNIDENGNI